MDLHAHTRASRDALTRPAELVERAARAGLHRIAVTDHGEVEGALEARAAGGERVIVGQEVRCRCGTELIGLFLAERVPMRLPLEEAVERIRAQGGLVYAPHPFAYATGAAWRSGRVLAVADVVEVFNSRAFLPAWNRRAAAAARARGLPAAASSDAHFPWEVGRAWTEVPPFTDAASFLEAARRAVPVGVRTANPFIHAASLGVYTVRTAFRHIDRPDPERVRLAGGKS
ncbi:MAG TPA: PHP-associated domain-containing protein [Longimicrobium sp.]